MCCSFAGSREAVIGVPTMCFLVTEFADWSCCFNMRSSQGIRLEAPSIYKYNQCCWKVLVGNSILLHNIVMADEINRW